MSIQQGERDIDQANELRQLLHEVEQGEEMKEGNIEIIEETASRREIDVLKLPPRKEIHTKNKRAKLKVSKPFLRLLFISLFVIAILIGTFYLWEGELAAFLNEL